MPDNEETALKLQSENKAILVDITTFSGDSFAFPYVFEGPLLPPEDYMRTAFCRQMGIPKVIAEFDRYVIREEKITDLDDIYEIYDDEASKLYLEPLDADPNKERLSREVYIKQQYGLFGFGMWVVEDKVTGNVVGRVGFENTNKEDEVHLGFVIKKEYRHKGLATKCIKEALLFMKENYSEYRVTAVCKKENIDSINLCKLLDVDTKLI